MGARAIVLAAGGTGGHVFPAAALAAALAARGHDLAFVTDGRGAGFGGGAKAAIHRISAASPSGGGWPRRLSAPFLLAGGAWQARRLLRRLRPKLVVGFGGYAAVPTALAAGWLNIPLLLHEQNAVLGRANRLLAVRARRIATGFADPALVPAAAADRCVVTGNPLRPAILARCGAPWREPGRDGPIGLLVTGGSQGARIFADRLPAAIALLPPTLRRRLAIVQQARPEDVERVRAAYAALDAEATVAPFFDDIADRLVAAHLVVCRAGAATVAELTAIGRPALLVPYAHAMDDHQSANARALHAAGAAWVAPEVGLTPESLAARLAGLLADPGRLAAAAAAARTAGRPDAVERLADLAEELAGCAGHAERRCAA